MSDKDIEVLVKQFADALEGDCLSPKKENLCDKDCKTCKQEFFDELSEQLRSI